MGDKSKRFVYSFANATVAIQKDAIASFNQEPWTALRTKCGTQPFFYLNQVHGNSGLVVTPDMLCDQRNIIDGDYLITNVPGVALTVFTADCLPIVMYDSVNNAIALIHAGWRGSVAHVAIKAFEHMRMQYGTQAPNLQVFFGPCAQVCCYQVDSVFVELLQKQIDYDVYQKVIQNKKGDWYFDLPLFNALQLQSIGIKSEQVHYAGTNSCTICNTTFCSYRREKQTDKRQLNIAFIV